MVEFIAVRHRSSDFIRRATLTVSVYGSHNTRTQTKSQSTNQPANDWNKYKIIKFNALSSHRSRWHRQVRRAARTRQTQFLQLD